MFDWLKDFEDLSFRYGVLSIRFANYKLKLEEYKNVRDIMGVEVSLHFNANNESGYVEKKLKVDQALISVMCALNKTIEFCPTGFFFTDVSNIKYKVLEDGSVEVNRLGETLAIIDDGYLEFSNRVTIDIVKNRVTLYRYVTPFIKEAILSFKVKGLGKNESANMGHFAGNVLPNPMFPLYWFKHHEVF